MIEFILSKFGIFLFVVSVAGILIMFSGNMKSIFVADEGMQLSSVITKQLKEMVDSPNLCVSTYVVLPKYIDIFGASGEVSTTSLYYFLDINVIPQTGNEKFVVFSIVNKRTGKQMSLESFYTDAEVNFFSAGEQYKSTTIDAENARIDPTETSVVYLVKNMSVINGTVVKKIYLMPCIYDKKSATPLNSCFAKLKVLSNSNPAENINCIPTGDPYEDVKNIQQ